MIDPNTIVPGVDLSPLVNARDDGGWMNAAERDKAADRGDLVYITSTWIEPPGAVDREQVAYRVLLPHGGARLLGLSADRTRLAQHQQMANTLTRHKITGPYRLEQTGYITKAGAKGTRTDLAPAPAPPDHDLSAYHNGPVQTEGNSVGF